MQPSLSLQPTWLPPPKAVVRHRRHYHHHRVISRRNHQCPFNPHLVRPYQLLRHLRTSVHPYCFMGLHDRQHVDTVYRRPRVWWYLQVAAHGPPVFRGVLPYRVLWRTLTLTLLRLGLHRQLRVVTLRRRNLIATSGLGSMIVLRMFCPMFSPALGEYMR